MFVYKTNATNQARWKNSNNGFCCANSQVQSFLTLTWKATF